MPKYLTKTKERDAARAIRVKRTAELTGVSIRQVYRVIEGQQVNEQVLSVFMHLMEMEEAAVDIARKTVLIKKVEATVPFN